MFDPYPRIVGILNVTPDSFYAASRFAEPARAVDRVRQLFNQGAWAVDIGACSTRPGAEVIDQQEELDRLLPVLYALAQAYGLGPDLPEGTGDVHEDVDAGSARPVFSIDTFRPAVVEAAYRILGPFWVNDVTAGTFDTAMMPLIAQLRLPWVAMHQEPYTGVSGVRRFFEQVLDRADRAGIAQTVLDPGFGFQKTVSENYELLEAVDTLAPRVPLLAGISRKRMIYLPLGFTKEAAAGDKAEEVLRATSALHLQLLLKGVSYLRVHDVPAASQIVQLYGKMRIFADKPSNC